MLPQKFTLHDYENEFADRHRLQDVVAKWAKDRPADSVLLSADGSRTLTWNDFDRLSTALAGELLRLGFAKGDFLVTMLPMSIDHVLLEYGCFKLGVIVAPLDLRLTSSELIRAVEALSPRGFVGLGVRSPFDFREMWRALQQKCPSIGHFIVMDSIEEIPGTRAYTSLADPASRTVLQTDSMDEARAAVSKIDSTIREEDGALVIFTTGSTGSPKPALLSHRNITVQNMCLSGAFFGGDRGSRTLVNLPASHVGGQTESLMTTLFGGGSVVLLDVFDASRSMRAISEHRVELLGQIPAMFHLEWMLKDYDRYDLSSLKFAAYGGNSVARPFVERLATMAPVIGSGLGLTECAGFCTYVQADASDHEMIVSGLGQEMPIYPCSIREAMQDNGDAGIELPSGEIGHVCFRGPQTFLGYVNDDESTAKAVSRDGYLYTGDLGYKDDKGLHLTGRAKWVIKSMGHQIFPGDVEAHLLGLREKVANCVVVGVPHEVVAEAVVAAIEKKPEVELSTKELDRHARSLPSFMRPRHWIILEAGKMPLNRIVKPDHLRVQEMAHQEIDRLRALGGWDSAHAPAKRAPQRRTKSPTRNAH
jgi:acyl-CoA synthetase (AMP-forming)/AMP-acid ligase II